MSRISWLLVAGLLVAPACGKKEQPLTPEQARTKGDALIKKMSDTVAGTKAFSYTTQEVRERVRRNGEKELERGTKKVVVRRPDALTFTASDSPSDGTAWYDGKSVTAVLDTKKVWVRGPMPATLDEALDYLAVEYAMQFPTADLLYSNPYEALLSAETTGGWVKAEVVDGKMCDHLAYQEGDVAWELWLTQDTSLPKKIVITYKGEEKQPRAEVLFRDWNPNPQITESTFAPVVPEGYTRIRLMRHASVEATPEPPSAASPPAK